MTHLKVLVLDNQHVWLRGCFFYNKKVWGYTNQNRFGIIDLHCTFLLNNPLWGLFLSHSQEEDLSSSSSEEEESDQRQNEDLFGKVVCVEGVAMGDKKKTTWYPALVSS